MSIPKYLAFIVYVVTTVKRDCTLIRINCNGSKDYRVVWTVWWFFPCLEYEITKV